MTEVAVVIHINSEWCVVHGIDCFIDYPFKEELFVNRQDVKNSDAFYN